MTQSPTTSTESPPFLSGWKPYVFLVLLCAWLFLPGQTTQPGVVGDEMYFAVATQQMMVSGDYVRIFYQDQPRNKKPIGIHWLQAASVHLFSEPGSTEIWTYRLPSVLGGLIAVLLTFAAGRRMFDTRTAVVGAALLASTVLMGVEVRSAKTDAVLLACIVAAQGALFIIYKAGREDQSLGAGPALTFWIATGLGILIKGPLGLLVSVLTMVALSVADRWSQVSPVRWWRLLRAHWGIPLAAVIVAPWIIAIQSATDGAFLRDALGGDFGQKLVGGHQGHGAPPGLYLLSILVVCWPASLFIWRGLAAGFEHRQHLGVRFCLAWLVPAWLVLELVPTKLLHYPFPVYPALVLLGAASVVALVPKQRYPLVGWLWTIAWAITGVVLAGLMVGSPVVLGSGFHFMLFIPAGIALYAIVRTLRARLHNAIPRQVTAVLLAQACTFPVITGFTFPLLHDLWISERLAAAVAEVETDPNAPTAIVEFREPSAIFLLGSDTVITTAQGAVDHLVEHPTSIVVVEERHFEAFERGRIKAGIEVEALTSVEGVNFTKGRGQNLVLHRRLDQSDTRNAGSG